MDLQLVGVSLAANGTLGDGNVSLLCIAIFGHTTAQARTPGVMGSRRSGAIIHPCRPLSRTGIGVRCATRPHAATSG